MPNLKKSWKKVEKNWKKVEKSGKKYWNFALSNDVEVIWKIPLFVQNLVFESFHFFEVEKDLIDLVSG